MSSISENVNVDRLSMLPEEIVSLILSLMPTKFAVRTSILSKRWRYSWMFVTNVDFDDIHPTYGIDRFTNFVDRVLKLCKTSQVKLFRLYLSKKGVLKSSVSNWIGEAVRLNVSELDIRVSLLEVPLSMLVCKTLTKLRLDLSACEDNVWECPSPVNLPCLKTLDIAVYTDPHDNAFKLIHGCPMLENLSFEVTFRHDAADYIFNIPTLKRLKLTLLKCGYAVNRVVLHVPNLEHLFVGGMLGSFFVIEDLPPLVEASVSFDCVVSSECTTCDLWAEFLKGISGVKSLSVQKFLFTFPLPIFPNMKHLELTRFWHYGKILERCPDLEYLGIVKFEEYNWIEPKSVPVCMLTSLATIKFSSCTGQNSEMQFLEYMLRKAEVLKTVTITWENLHMEDEKRLCVELLELPRASRYCEIHFIGN